VFALSWFATRLYAFGFIVIRSTLTDTYQRAEEVGGVNIEPHVSILNGLLIFLYVLHVYWSYLIVKIIVRSLTPGGQLDDIREEDDQDKKSR
jgi:ceramide synthetase